MWSHWAYPNNPWSLINLQSPYAMEGNIFQRLRSEHFFGRRGVYHKIEYGEKSKIINKKPVLYIIMYKVSVLFKWKASSVNMNKMIPILWHLSFQSLNSECMLTKPPSSTCHGLTSGGRWWSHPLLTPSGHLMGREGSPASGFLSLVTRQIVFWLIRQMINCHLANSSWRVDLQLKQ